MNIVSETIRHCIWFREYAMWTKNGVRIARHARVKDWMVNAYRKDPEPFKKAGVTIKLNTTSPTKWATLWRIPTQQELDEWAQTEADSSTISLHGANFNIPSPPDRSLFEFQQAGVKFMVNRNASLLGDEQGLGKTPQIIGVINMCEDIARAMIVCPAGLKANWEHELSMWLLRDLSVGIASGQYFPESDIVIINYDILWKYRTHIRSIQWDLVACDEAHYLKNPDSRRTKAIFGHTPMKREIAAGAEVIEPLKANRKILATGTPMPNRTKELFPLLNWLNPEKWGKDKYREFVVKYCGGHHMNSFWDGGSTNPDLLQQELRRNIMIRRLKVDAMKELPPKFRQTIWIPNESAVDFWQQDEEFSTERKQMLREQLEKCCAAYEIAKCSGFDEYRRVSEVMDDISKMASQVMATVRKRIATAKVEPCSKIIGEGIEQFGKVIVFAHHIEAQQSLVEKFPGCIYLPGGMDSHKKQALVRQFQEDSKVKIAVLSLRGSSTGLTLTKAKAVYMMEWDWVPGVNMQAEDRAHRIGQVESVTCIYMVLEGSLDDVVVNVILNKQDMIDKTLNMHGMGEKLEYDVRKLFDAEQKKLATEAAKLSNRDEIRRNILTIHNSNKLMSVYDRALCRALVKCPWTDLYYPVANRFGHRHRAILHQGHEPSSNTPSRVSSQPPATNTNIRVVA